MSEGSEQGSSLQARDRRAAVAPLSGSRRVGAPGRPLFLFSHPLSTCRACPPLCQCPHTAGVCEECNPQPSGTCPRTLNQKAPTVSLPSQTPSDRDREKDRERARVSVCVCVWQFKEQLARARSRSGQAKQGPTRMHAATVDHVTSGLL